MKRLLIMFFVSTVYHALYSMDFNQPSDAYLKDFAFNFFMHGYIKSLDIDSHRQENTQSINDNEIPAAKREPIVFNQDEKSRTKNGKKRSANHYNPYAKPPKKAKTFVDKMENLSLKD